MQLQGRNLSFGMQGEDVELLQMELGDKLGHQFARDEIQQKRFGQTTRRAVIEFQKQLGQEATGVVNEPSATLINQAVNAVYVVQGVVMLLDGTPLPGVIVRASDVDLRSRQIVAEGITNEQGSYKITYGFKDFRSRDMRGPDLIVAAFTPDGDPLSDPEPKPKYNAGTTETIDLVVQPPTKPELSESERLLDALSLWPDVGPAELNNNDLDFLENEFAGKPLEVVITEPPVGTRSLFAVLAHAARITQQTPGLPTEFFYGVARWLRLDPAFEVDRFLTRPALEIRKAFLESIEKNIIPAKLRDSLETIMTRFEHWELDQGILVQREFVGRLIMTRDNEAEPVEPLAGYRVRVLDLDADPEPRALGDDITNKPGLFTFVYLVPAKPPEGEREVPGRKFRLHIAAPQGQELHIDPPLEIQVKPDQRQVLDVPVPAAVLPKPPTQPLDDLNTRLNLRLPRRLLRFLQNQNVNTTQDIRRKGGISRIEGLPVRPDHPAVQTLEAHANLSILSSDVRVNAALFEAGFRHITDIANLPRAEFVTKLHTQLGDFKAAQLHEMTKAQVNFLNSELMGFKVEFANGSLSGLPEALHGRLPDWFQIKCQCDECEAAVSPLAYLADLLHYAVLHVREAEAPMTLTSLASTFHQPFPDLPASCEELKKHVRQIRICIEVLRGYLGSRPLDGLERSIREIALRQAEKQYREAVYTTLLNKIGTSYGEIRLARSLDRTPENEEDRETLKQLVNRLGIDLGSERPDHIAKLFLDPFATAPLDALTEEALERLFGLVDTTREPLSEGAKLYDADGQLKRWNLSGVTWNQNTDANGRIYVRLRRPAAGGFRVELYRDAPRTQLVASGQRLSPVGKVEVSEENRSGLSGAFELNFITRSDDIELSVIPEFLSWRLAHLRTLWQEQDFPTDSYTQGFSPEIVEELGYWPYPRPLIDPDVIGPDDFRYPDASAPDGAFTIWVNRRAWVDDRLEELQEDRFKKVLTNTEGRVVRDEAGRPIRVPDIEVLLDHMYAVDSINYDGSPYGPAWADSTPKANLVPLSKALSEGSKEEIEDAKRRIQDDLNLTVESFTRLMEVYRKDKLATGDDRYARVEEDEWQEVYSILVQTKKTKVFGVWRAEEDAAGLQFGPPSFWACLREPEVGEWSRKLQENRPPVPLIDPEMLKVDDLPEPTAGKSARAIWQQRLTELEHYKNTTLVEAREDDGFDSLFRAALGERLAANVGDFYRDLRSGVEANVRGAERRVTEDLFMSVEDFERLMTIRQKELEGETPPTEVEWEDVYSILTSVYKQRVLFRRWIRRVPPAGERGIPYWRAFKAKLPRWRAASEARQQWQQALRNRSSRPIIDPDLIVPVDLKRPVTGDHAFDVWSERWTWLHGDPSRGIPGRLTALQDEREALGDDRAWMATILTTIVGVSTADLEELAEQHEQGNDIQARLAQLSLDIPAFSHLLRIARLIASDPPAPVLDSEWGDVYSILVGVAKRRMFAAWREEEAESNMTLGPDYFKIPELPFEFPPKEPEPLPVWRTTWRDRRDWEDTLQSRIEQEQPIIEGLREAVSATEEMTLPMLRDALVRATGKSGRELTKLLLIDCEMSACQNTTRIAQAIETSQGLLWSLRTGQFRDTHPALTLHADHFDAEWDWIGSYATWRAAMFVCMYPENILLPHLRRRQTPAFKHLVQELRDNHRLTPEETCEAANRYAKYIRDVSNLTLEASVYAETIAAEGDCRARTSTRDRDLVYIFARSGGTNTVYVSWYEPNDSASDAQSFWSPVPGLEEVDVIDIVGAAAYAIPYERRFIYLFLRTREEGTQKLVYTRFDLQQGSWSGETQGWSGETQELKLPEETTEFTAVVKQRNREDEPPHLALRVPSGAIYARRLNGDGNGWEDKEFELLVDGLKARSLQGLHAMIEVSPGQFYVFVPGFDLDTRVVRYRLFGEKDDGRWRVAGGLWVGGFFSADQVYTVCKTSESAMSGTRYGSIQSDDRIQGPEIGSFREFDTWLLDVVGVTLDHISLAALILFYASSHLEDRADPMRMYEWAAGLSRSHGINSFLDFLQSASGSIPEPDFLSSHELKLILIRAFGEHLNSPNDPGVRWQDWKVADELVRKFLISGDGIGLTGVLLGFLGIRGSLAYGISFPVRFWIRNDRTRFSPGMPGLQRLVHGAGFPAGHVAYQRELSSAGAGVFRSVYTPDETVVLRASFSTLIAPIISQPFELTERIASEERRQRRHRIQQEFQWNRDENAPSSVLTYLEEAWYFVPIHIAMQLQRRRQFVAALDWFRTVYDYSHFPAGDRSIYHPLRLGYDLATGFTRSEEWLLDPLNPHAIAATRGAEDIPTSAPAYARFTIISLIRCLLEFADVEFTQDTAESVARARMLYMTALELLDLPELKPLRGDCEDLIRTIDIDPVDPAWRDPVRELRRELTHSSDLGTLEPLVMEVNAIIHLDEPMAIRHARLVERINRELLAQPGPLSYGIIVERQAEKLKEAHTALLAYDSIATAAERISHLTAVDVGAALTGVIEHFDSNGHPDGFDSHELPWLRATPGIGPPVITPVPIADDMPGLMPPDGIGLDSGGLLRLRDNVLKDFARLKPETLFELWRKMPFPFALIPPYDFCVPPNPLLRALRLHAELNLYKIHMCRNIAGMERTLEPYAAPTDAISGMPFIGEAGQLVVPVTIVPPPTPYRYEYLIERAKQLADRASQMEAAFLAALEKRDAEYYNLMKARQDIQLARANVRLQELRVQEAEDGVTLAELQRDRAQIEADQYQEWLDAGANAYEELALSMLEISLVVPDSISFGWSGTSISFSPSGKFQTLANIFSIMADRERRHQEWVFRSNLALQDVRIGNQQIELAWDRVRIVSQERVISKMQADFAEDTANFLATKFTSVELYDWMSGVLEEVYNVFLQEATAVGKLAEAQLAFERQQIPASSIQADYWEAPSDDAVTETVDGNTPNRRGLTGSARLLADILRLDQYKFETEKRKLQLTKTISLARLAPAEFQQFRETGVMHFATSMELFDRDFPGHYLRLIKRVRTSVIALIPPTAGINATFATTGLSRVVVGNNGLYQENLIRRSPESVALSSPGDATGLFELTPQSQEMLLPFEGIGVDTAWEFRMPKASNLFDYNTIADVLITVEYTALDSFDYRQQVIQELDSRISADRPFSFRQEFADQWYDLHNPDQTAMPMVVRFITRREDFPPNIEDLRIQQVVLYFAPKSGASFEIPVTQLHFTESGADAVVGGGATPIDGVISTRRGNAGSWTAMIGKSPMGEWQLALPNTEEMKNRFKNEEVEDMLFVITYAGHTPAWPV